MILIKHSLRLILLLVIFNPISLLAETIRDIDYSYDGSGNIIGIKVNQVSGPPDISSIEPNFIRLSNSLQGYTINVTGSDLYLTTVSIDTEPNNFDVVINSSNNVFANGNIFSIVVDPNAITEDYVFLFTNPFGTTSLTLTLAPRLPSLIFNIPSLNIIDPIGTVVDVGFSLNSPDIIEHVFTFTVEDPTVATISPSSVIIPAGSTVPNENIQVTALSLGNTLITATSSSYGDVGRFVDVADAGVCEFSPPLDDPTAPLVSEVTNKLNFVSMILFTRLDQDFGVSSGLIPIAQGLPSTTSSFLNELDVIQPQIDQSLGGQCPPFEEEECTSTTPDVCYTNVINEINKIRILVAP